MPGLGGNFCRHLVRVHIAIIVPGFSQIFGQQGAYFSIGHGHRAFLQNQLAGIRVGRFTIREFNARLDNLPRRFSALDLVTQGQAVGPDVLNFQMIFNHFLSIFGKGHNKTAVSAQINHEFCAVDFNQSLFKFLILRPFLIEGPIRICDNLGAD